ncbi:His-Xaa-Ser system protein HxsD [Candidatus Woesearchaeota archaeon]|nr:His-Xaa-Ser system protein HxsD [Candidatus Woesearchaeota archaeon]
MAKKKSEQVKIISNLEIYPKEKYVIVSVNPKIYPMDVVYSASYVFLDKAYLILDGDPEEEIIVELRPKKKDQEIEILGREFNNELLNYAVYKNQARESKNIKEAIVNRALETNSECRDVSHEPKKNFETKSFEEEIEYDEDMSYVDDPLGIAVPWEEKYGKKQK